MGCARENYLFFIFILFMTYIRNIYYICFMLVTKTIRIDDELHKDATDHIKGLGVSGGFSGYIQTLIINDLKKNKNKPKQDQNEKIY